jgi:hypothetical protein
VQRLEVLIAVMLARERMRAADAAGDGCTALAAALATLPSRPLKMIANAVAALGVATVRDECTAASGSDVLSFRTMPADHERWRSRSWPGTFKLSPARAGPGAVLRSTRLGPAPVSFGA